MMLKMAVLPPIEREGEDGHTRKAGVLTACAANMD
jgi:hypothetical protein